MVSCVVNPISIALFCTGFGIIISKLISLYKTSAQHSHSCLCRRQQRSSSKWPTKEMFGNCKLFQPISKLVIRIPICAGNLHTASHFLQQKDIQQKEIRKADNQPLNIRHIKPIPQRRKATRRRPFPLPYLPAGCGTSAPAWLSTGTRCQAENHLPQAGTTTCPFPMTVP